ncbi:DUF4238 domain-containing protein [Patescibacteria group bacterium]|nr:DUF4238 domain-containing protein [Patescibacteria group bacterium]
MVKTHLVSQTLLKRFADKGLIRVTNLVSGKDELKGLRQIAYLNVHDKLFSKLEKKWGNIESSATTAFDSLEQGTLLKIPSHKGSIKRFMTLHYVRSPAFVDIMARDEPDFFRKYIQNVKKESPDTTNYIEKNLPSIRSNWLAGLVKMVPGMLKTNAEKVEGYVNQFDIEIGIAPEGTEFILGDNPTLTVSKDGRIGIRSGVTINESIGFSMPLGPRHLAALIKRNSSVEYIQLNSKQVENANNKTKNQCIKEYYSSPVS